MFRRSFVYVKHCDSSGRAGGLAFGIVIGHLNKGEPDTEWTIHADAETGMFSLSTR
jgi:hypothetical protein